MSFSFSSSGERPESLGSIDASGWASTVLALDGFPPKMLLTTLEAASLAELIDADATEAMELELEAATVGMILADSVATVDLK